MSTWRRKASSVKPDIFEELMGLFEWRLDEEEAKTLREEYARRRQSFRDRNLAASAMEAEAAKLDCAS